MAKRPVDLVAAANRAMRENGFQPEFEPKAERQVEQILASPPKLSASGEVRDLRTLLWSSIDNEESKDLDQIEVAERLPDGTVRVKVGIAEVDTFVPQGSAIDAHAEANTASVYTGVVIFPMLPTALSEDLTSLLPGKDRLAVVIEIDVADDGSVVRGEVYRALVHNHAKLTYDGLAAWLDGREGPPPEVTRVPGLEAQVSLQHRVAQKLKAHRHENGALELETIEARPVAKDGEIIGLEVTRKSRSRELVEDFMIAANGAMARFLESKNVSTIRRVVRSPERWQRIVALAEGLGDQLPPEADAIALTRFLSRQRAKDPDRFPDLSLSIVKLMGPGEYALDPPGGGAPGHFGLAASDYTHSTAPNRRFPDLITQRILKALLSGAKAPYDDAKLAEIAARCTEKGNHARKVERTMRKIAAAVFLEDRVGETFDAIVTGATPKGTFVRLITPPAEGRLVRGEQGLDVGDALRVELVATEPSKGFIDFARA